MSGASVPGGVWINLGSGPACADGWISVDGSWQAAFAGRPFVSRVVRRISGRQVGEWPVGIVRCDLRKRLPFGDASAAVVYSSHALEHLHRDEAVAVLREARRVLEPGGICRVVVPDVAAIVRWYLERAEADPEGASDQLLSMMMLRPRGADAAGPLAVYRRLTDFDAHKWMYDGPGLVKLFRDAGFECASARGYLESTIDRERLAQVERADRVVDGAGVCVEGRR